MAPKNDAEKSEWLHKILVQYEGSLLRYAGRLLGNKEKAKEMVQETFVSLWKEDPRKVSDRLPPWLYRVCRNKVLDFLRKEKRMELLPDPEIVPDDPVADKTTHLGRKVMQFLEKLPKNQKEVVILKFQNDLSYKEISEVTGLSISNVGYLLHHAMSAIRSELAL